MGCGLSIQFQFDSYRHPLNNGRLADDGRNSPRPLSLACIFKKEKEKSQLFITMEMRKLSDILMATVVKMGKGEEKENHSESSIDGIDSRDFRSIVTLGLF